MAPSEISAASSRGFIKLALALGLAGGASLISGAAMAEQLACPAAKRIEATGQFPPANKKIG